MLLSGNDILENIEQGFIEISPFQKHHINPNSYDLTLDNKLITYKHNELYMNRENEFITQEISESGLLLNPNKLYLCKTVERTKTNRFAPMLEGRSSIARLGLHVHISAGFGDVGFNGHWTLELSCVQPIVIYPFVRIAQIYFFKLSDLSIQYEGKYQNNESIQTSYLFREFNNVQK